jgi:hypothetical protein
MRWEYKTIELEIKHSLATWDTTFHTLGADGWQLQSSIPLLDISFGGATITRGARLIFVRPNPESTPQM